MSQFFKINSDNPQLHLIRQAAALVKKGGVLVYPTDSAYALGCQMSNLAGIQRLRRIRGLKDTHPLTLLCRDISELSCYARLEDSNFRLIKFNELGTYTFLLPATKKVPKYIVESKQKTVGIRLPNHKIVRALLEMLDQPLVSSTLILPGSELPLLEPEAMRDLLGNRIDLIIDGGPCGLEPSTVVDLVDGNPTIVRKGKGSITPFLVAN